MRKFTSYWVGPFRVIEKRSPLNYGCRRLAGKKEKLVVHIARMKAFVDPLSRPIEPPQEWPENQAGERIEADPEAISMDRDVPEEEIIVPDEEIEAEIPMEASQPELEEE